MATIRQVNYILHLLSKQGYNTRYTNAAYQRLGATGGWRRGQDPRDWVESLNAKEASEVIDTLLSEDEEDSEQAPEGCDQEPAHDGETPRETTKPSEAMPIGIDGAPAPDEGVRLTEIANLWYHGEPTRRLLDLTEIDAEDAAPGDVVVYAPDGGSPRALTWLSRGTRGQPSTWQRERPCGRIWRLTLRADVTPQEARRQYREL
jgi:hypothetical protein